METLLPSEIARLIYGYLENQNCTEAAQCFLETCPLLAECLAAQKKGRRIVSRVNGLNLTEILDDYCDSHFLVAEHKQTHPEYSKSSSDSLKLTPQLKVLLDICALQQHQQQGVSKPSKSCVSINTQTTEPYPTNIPSTSAVPTTQVITAVQRDAAILVQGQATASNTSAPNVEEITTTATYIREPEIAETEIIAFDSPTVSILSSPNKRKTPRKHHNSLNSGDSDSASSIKDIIRPDAIIRPLLDSTQLHEKLAEKINEMLSASNASEGNQSEEEKNYSDTSNAAAISSVVEQTQADPIFDQLMNEIFSTAFPANKNSSESDDHGTSRRASSEGEDMETPQASPVAQKESTVAEISHEPQTFEVPVPPTPQHIPCLIGMPETPRSPGPPHTVIANTPRELNAPIHCDSSSQSSMPSTKKATETRQAAASQPEPSTSTADNSYPPLKARLRSAHKRMSVAPTENADSNSSSVAQDSIIVLEDQNAAAVTSIIETVPIQDELAHEPCVLISTDVCVEMPSEVQEALTNNTMVLKSSASGKDILELAMTNSSVVTPERPAPVTTFANSIFTSTPLTIAQPVPGPSAGPSVTLLPQSNIFLPEHGRFLAIPATPKTSDKRVITIAPKAPLEAEHDCRYLRNKQSKQLRAKEARTKGVKLVPDRRIQKEATPQQHQSPKLVNVLESTTPSVANPKIILATVGTAISEPTMQSQGIISMPSISPLRPLPVVPQPGSSGIVAQVPEVQPAEPEMAAQSETTAASELAPEVAAEAEMAAPAATSMPTIDISSPVPQQSAVRRCPPRKSMSTPRRDRSHIRTLDFSTPPHGKAAPRRALTSPKGKPPQVSPNTETKLSRAKRIVRAELFQASDDVLQTSSSTIDLVINEEQSTTIVSEADQTVVISQDTTVEDSQTNTVIPDLSSTDSQMEIVSPQHATTTSQSNLSESENEPSPSISGIATRNPGEPRVTRSCWDKVSGVGLIIGSPTKSVPPVCVSARKAFGKDWDSELRSLIIPIEAPTRRKRIRDLSSSSERGGKKMKKVISKEIISQEDDFSTDDDFESPKPKSKSTPKTYNNKLQKTPTKEDANSGQKERDETSSSEDESQKRISRITKKTGKKSKKVQAKETVTPVQEEIDVRSSSEDISSKSRPRTSKKTSKKSRKAKTKKATTNRVHSKQASPVKAVSVETQIEEMSGSEEEDIAEDQTENVGSENSESESAQNTATQANELSSVDEPPKSKTNNTSKSVSKTRKIQNVSGKNDRSEDVVATNTIKNVEQENEKQIEANVPKVPENNTETITLPNTVTNTSKAVGNIQSLQEPTTKVIIQSPRSVSKHVVIRNEIHGDHTKSPRRTLELAGTALSYITPCKIDEPSASQEETPITKLLRGHVMDDLELTLVETPIFPLTPNYILPSIIQNVSPPSPPEVNYFPTTGPSNISQDVGMSTENSNVIETETTIHVIEENSEVPVTLTESTESRVIDSIIDMEPIASTSTSSTDSSFKSVEQLLAEAQTRIGLRKSSRNKSKAKSLKIVVDRLSPEDIAACQLGNYKSNQDENRPPSSTSTNETSHTLLETDIPPLTLDTEDEMSLSSAAQLLQEANKEREQDESLLSKLEETRRRMADRLKQDFARNEPDIVHLTTGPSKKVEVFGRTTRGLLAQRFGKRNAKKPVTSYITKPTKNISSEVPSTSKTSTNNKSSATEKVASSTIEKKKNLESEKHTKSKTKEKSPEPQASTSSVTRKDNQQQSRTEKQRKSRDKSKEKVKDSSKINHVKSPEIPRSKRKESKAGSDKREKSQDKSRDKIAKNIEHQNNASACGTKQTKDKSSESIPEHQSTTETESLSERQSKNASKESSNREESQETHLQWTQTETAMPAEVSTLSNSNTSIEDPAKNTSVERLVVTRHKVQTLPNIIPPKDAPKRSLSVEERSPRKRPSPVKISPRKNISVDEIAIKLRGVIGGSDEDDSMPPLVYSDSPVDSEPRRSIEGTILEQLGLHSCQPTPTKASTDTVITPMPSESEQQATQIRDSVPEKTPNENIPVNMEHNIIQMQGKTSSRQDQHPQGAESNVVAPVPIQSTDSTQENTFISIPEVPTPTQSVAQKENRSTRQEPAVAKDVQVEKRKDRASRTAEDLRIMIGEQEFQKQRLEHERLQSRQYHDKHPSVSVPHNERRPETRPTQNTTHHREERQRSEHQQERNITISTSQSNAKVYRMQHEEMNQFKHLTSRRKLKRMKINVEQEDDKGRVMTKSICLNFTQPTTLFSISPEIEHHTSRHERSREDREGHYSRHRTYEDRDTHRHRPGEREVRGRYRVPSDDREGYSRYRHSHSNTPEDRHKPTEERETARPRSYTSVREDSVRSHETRRYERDSGKRRATGTRESATSSRSSSSDHRTPQEMTDHKRPEKHKIEHTQHRQTQSEECHTDDELMTYALVGSVREISPSPPTPNEGHPLPLKKRRGPTEGPPGSKSSTSSKQQRKTPDNPQDMLRKVGMDNLLSVLHGDADL